jgi:hypothetical protein
MHNMAKKATLKVVTEAKATPKRKSKRVTKAQLVEEKKELELEKKELEELLEAEREARTPKHSLATTMTGVMSAIIPLFGTVFAMVAGHCFRAGNLGLSAMGSVAVFLSLSVSMPHLAHAISLLTKSSKRASVTLAIAFDLGVVLSEAGRVFGPQDTHTVLTISLFVLMGLSGVLNYIAFRAGEGPQKTA